MLQVEVGEVGSEQHAQREHMLRSAIELQTQLKQSQQKLEALTQQLADTPSEAQDTHTSADAATPATHSVKVATQHTSVLMDLLFGSDDNDVGVEGSGSQVAQVKTAPTGKQQAGSAAGVAQLRRQTTTGAAQTAGTAHVADVADQRAGAPAHQGSLHTVGNSVGNSSNRAQHSTTAGPSQPLVDPAAPRRTISFSNSLRRRQASSIQQRKDAFNAAADAAVLQAAAQRSAAGSQAAVSASGPSPGAVAAKSEADESMRALPEVSLHRPMHGTSSGIDINQAPVKPSSASVPDQEVSVMPSALPRQPSVTQDLPGGRVQSAAAPPAPARTAGLMPQGCEEVPKVITRTSQAEPAPKLKTGSRLAASMAKLAASKRAPSDQPAPVAAAAMQQIGDGQKKSVIPEDVKRSLLAKVR